MASSASTRYVLPLSVRQELAAYESAIAAGCSSDEARDFARDLYGDFGSGDVAA